MLRAVLVLTALLTVLLTSCAGTDPTGPVANDTGPAAATTTDTTSAPPSAAPSASRTGGALTISAWDLTFTLPDTIPPSDVTLLDHTTDGGGFVDLASATLEDALDPDACGGSSVDQGQFAQVARADDASADAEDTVVVGEHVYAVRVSTHLAACYPDELVQRYLDEDVAVAIRESLTVS